MAYTTINKPSDYFNTKLYTGNGSTNAITGVGFQPDLVWLKSREAGGYHHTVFDAVRGVTKAIYTDLTHIEQTLSTGLTSFDSDGFTIGSNGDINSNTHNCVSWNWLANGAGSSNTDGSITSTVSASTTSGFSIVKYTGTGASATVGHGLNTIPNFVIFKKLTVAINNWRVQTNVTGSWTRGYLDETNAFDSPTFSATSTYVSIDSGSEWNSSGADYIMYCFNSVKGFSKFGSYTGNGNADGTFIYTGFKPAFIMVKRTDTADGWQMFDNKRDIDNVIEARLEADTQDAEYTLVDWCDFLSNGIKMRYTGGGVNASGGSYIYMAFAEHPLVSSTGTPCTAR